ncbi:pyridoxamine 5'-phosphate oxidase family protein [Alicycliphilus denitrificans]|uniref:pyridoxamine 5'-phosphate oxidase family protein n=1 Tax=Alicycliphilus denitrificans TaxID=179636 RepID=UPI00384CA044
MPALLSPEHIALVDRGVSAIVASRDARLRPSVMRAVGARIRADGRRITVFLRKSQSQQLLADIAATGHIAVVFSDPPSHRTVQVKATAALQRALRPADETALQRYLAAMQQAVAQVGYGPPYTAAMLSAPRDDLVAVEFTPEAAFDQTPGPRAGMPLPAGGTP